MSGKQGYYLLILNFDTHRLRIVYYKTSQAENANAAYTQIEKNRVEAKIDASPCCGAAEKVSLYEKDISLDFLNILIFPVIF